METTNEELNLATLDFAMFDFGDEPEPKTKSEVNHRAESFEKLRAAYEAKMPAPVVAKPVSVGYIGFDSAMFVFAFVGTKIVKVSQTAYREGPALSRAVEAAMAAHPGCDLVCSPKRSWVTR